MTANKDKKTDEEVEAILMALDQMGQTLEVMHQMIGRLKDSVIEVDERSQRPAKAATAAERRRTENSQENSHERGNRERNKETQVSDTPIVLH